MAAKVYKEWKLSRGDNGGFNRDHKTLRKQHTVIDEQLAEIYNSNTDSSGLLYEVDEVATAELNKDISKRMSEKIAKNTKISFNPIEKAPVVEKEIEETPDQKKYNTRKAKMIEAGWLFHDDSKSFTKGDDEVTAEKLLSLSNVLYGKLLKQ